MTWTQRIRNAVASGVVARANYYATIDLPDEQMLGDPAPQESVEALETLLQRPLPHSYRTFLACFDGWVMVDGGVDLYSTTQLLSPSHQRSVLDWKNTQAARGDSVAMRCLVIGGSHVTATQYLLDPERVSDDGEWLFLQHHNGVEAEVPSFGQWLEESVGEYHMLAGGQAEESDNE